MRAVALAVITTLLVPMRCTRRDASVTPTAGRVTPRPEPSASPDQGPTRMEELAGTTPPIYVMRGHRDGSTPIVVLHGMCSHALGYAQSFQWSAAKKGIVVAPQGDKPCGGPWASWTADLAALD